MSMKGKKQGMASLTRKGGKRIEPEIRMKVRIEEREREKLRIQSMKARKERRY